MVNVAPPVVSLVLSLLTHGLKRDAVKTWNGDEDGKKKGKKGKKGKNGNDEVGFENPMAADEDES